MKLPKLPDRTKELYAEYHPQALGYEKKIGELMRERAELLGKKEFLSQNESERLFDTAKEIELLFEYQSMTLPFLEDPKTQSCWDSCPSY
ncbi:MAG: hypothetical protein UX89_C0014G0040 [Parcubacteria group bacterium GW2011_GWA2_47_16]|nr:MAG: hypothetical protein UX89_C0014G0040 [Parcubacteria group bacterium GW2011_GWA2_47_16]